MSENWTYGAGWLSDGLPDAEDSPLDLDGWLEREDTLASGIKVGAVCCRDELDVRMLVEAFEASTAFAALDCMRPHEVASRCKSAYRLQAKLTALAGRHVQLPPDFT